MPAVTVSTMYVNYFISLKSRLFGEYRLQLLPVLNYGTIKVGEELNILTILWKTQGGYLTLILLMWRI